MQPIHAPRAVDVTTAQLRQLILSGHYKVGQHLPPERNLATELNINRTTLRSALAQLQSEGLVQVRQGDGTRAMDYRISGGVELIRFLPVEDEKHLLQGFFEMRRAIAAEAVALACQRATQTDLEELTALAAQQQQEQEEAPFMERDIAFARRVLRATGNLPMELTFNTVARLYHSRPRIVSVMLQDMELVKASYGLVIELIKKGDSDTARNAVRQALEHLDTRTMDRLDKTE